MKTQTMRKRFIAMLLAVCLAVGGMEGMGSMMTVSAADTADEGLRKEEATGKENSWRYKDGEPIETESEEDTETVSKFARATAPLVMMKGIDISEHNGKINWKKVKASGKVDYVIIRCGYGQNMTSQDDDYWVQNVQGCIENDIPFGVYLYSYAKTDESALGEAKHTLRLLESAKVKGKKQFKFPVYFDMEDQSVVTYINKKASTTTKRRARYTSLAKTYCNELEKAGYVVGIYANYSWFTNYLTDSAFDGWTKWVAQYNSSCWYSKPYDMWQYSSSGKVSGMSGAVDMNYYYRADFLQQAVASAENSTPATNTPAANTSTTNTPAANTSTTNTPAANTSTTNTPATPAVSVGKVAGLKQSKRTASAISLSWNAVSNATGYQIFRSKSPNGAYSLIKTTSAKSWTNSKLSANRQYYYKVRAYQQKDGKAYYGSYSSVLNAYTSEIYQRTLTAKGTSRVRIAAGTAYSIRKTVKKGQKMSVVAHTYDKSGKKWYRVTLKVGKKKYTGYIRYDLVSVKRTVKTRQKITLRKTASTKARAVKSVPKNVTLTYRSFKTVSGSNWYKVSYKAGKKAYTGYIKAKYLKW